MTDQARSFDGAAPLYAAARPDYPAAALDWLLPAGVAEVTGNAMRASRRDPQIPGLPELFEPPQTREVAHVQPLTPDGLRQLVQTHSGFLVLDDGGRSALLEGVDRLLAEHPELAGCDRIDLPYSTLCWRATRR